jgi:hypothetical protein
VFRSLPRDLCNQLQGRGTEGEPKIDKADDSLYAELWISLASLLRSYTAVHGLHFKKLAEIETDQHRIAARCGDKWLELRREGTVVAWTRENESNGVLELTDHGRLRGPEGDEEMDMAAEAWARELMR